MRLRKSIVIAAVITVITGASVAVHANRQPDGCAVSGYDRTVLDDGPVMYLPLGADDHDCPGADTLRQVGEAAPGTLPNGDAALVFDGVSQYAEVGDTAQLSVATTGSLTIEAWLRPDTLQFPRAEGAGYVHWLAKGEADQQEYVARMYSQLNGEGRPNRLSGYAFNAAGGFGVGSYAQEPVTVGEWIHYGLVITTDRSPGNLMGHTALVVNGVRRDQDSLAELRIRPADGDAPLRIGGNLHSFFHGAIGKVAIYDRALTALELAEHHEAMGAAS
ncbi:LamG domain-containing protein [Pilimelia columellifera]|uniref:LamG domain-containing protein n=1 Tax=Pilimelia columellifera subsp. columellifera TaxID=706583 RepID=A0ABN3NGY6_9ACTN